ncbi:MAG: CDP-alcohol phosphatidyltransferase family protein [Cytophagales bacterium]|nr:CDP-alcohol phosphatidyltransferase family protein [Cytophagales bacterium]
MIDRPLAKLIKPCVDRAARSLIQIGLEADTLTVIGFALGLASAGLIANGYFLSGLILLLVSRTFDALDGAVARLNRPTDRGGFLDITLDFIFYASIALAFAVANPAANALAAATLLFAFMGTSSSFLAYASFAAKRGDAPSPSKAIHYLGGLTEAFETLFCFALMCIMPQHFSILAYGFATMCFVTTTTRIYAGWQHLKE